MFSVFKRRGATLLVDGGGDASARGDRRKSSSVQLCMQLSLLCACIVILFFGLAVTAIGFWGYRSQKEYLSITERDPELTRLPTSMMVTGGFVAILGFVGVVGSLFSRTISGQTLLGVFSFVLVLVIISEVGAGAAAIRLKFKLDAVFVATAQQSQGKYNTNNETARNWDVFQMKHGCCGASGFVNGTPPYYHVLQNASVPLSCCKKGVEPEDCETFSQNATQYKEYIYDRGCSMVAVDRLTTIVTVIAIITIVIGSTQLLAILLAVIVAYMSSKLDRNQKNTGYTYNKLLQQEELQQEDSSQPT